MMLVLKIMVMGWGRMVVVVVIELLESYCGWRKNNGYISNKILFVVKVKSAIQ